MHKTLSMPLAMQKMLVAVVAVFSVALFFLVSQTAHAQFGPPMGLPEGMMGGPGDMMGQGNPGQQTCRIQGVEMPGPCSRNDSSSGGKGAGMMNPPGGMGFDPGMMGDGEGPSEEQMEEMQKKQMAMQMKGMLRGMKAGMRGMSQGVKMMKSALTKLVKQGIEAPQELSEALAKAEVIIADLSALDLNTISDPEELMDKMSEMAEVGPVLQEWGPKMQDLFRLGQMMKEADRRLKKVQSDVKRAKTQGAKLKVDVSENLANLDTAVATLAQLLADAKAKSDPDEKLEAIESFFDSMQDIYDTIGLIESLKNYGKAKAGWNRQVKKNDQTVKMLKRKKLETSELESAQNDIKGKLAEVSTVLSTKPIDAEALLGALEELKGLQEAFNDAVDTLTGVESAVPQMQVEKFSVPKMNFGMFEQFRKEKNGNGNGEDVESAE